MSQLVYCHSGGKTRLQKLRVGITVSNAGTPLIAPIADNNGVVLGTVTAGINQVGMSTDTATYNTAQQTGSVDPAEFVTVCTNSDAVWASRLCGSASVEGTALTPYYNTVASATGVLLTLSATSNGSTVDMSAVDDAVFFCYSGANAGHWRRGVPADGTDVNITQAFPYAIAVDDVFFVCPVMPYAIEHSVTWTTNLYEVDSVVTTAVNALNTYRAIELNLNDVGNNGLLNSYVNLIATDHFNCHST